MELLHEQVTGRPWRFDGTSLLYSILIVEDYRADKQTHSCIIFRMHHALGDGISASILLQSLSDNFDARKLNLMQRPSLLLILYAIITVPYQFLAVIYVVITSRPEYNIITTPPQLPKDIDDSHKWQYRGMFKNDFDLAEIKQFVRTHGCSINDYYFALISCSLYGYIGREVEYYRSQNVTTPEDLDVLRVPE